MQRWFFALAPAIVGLLFLLPACGSGEGTSVGGELHVFNWEDYFAPNTLDDFESEFGIDVFLETYDYENVAVSAIQSDPSRYDVVVFSDELIAEMTDLKLLAELNLESIPNLANIDPQFLNQPWDPGNRYSVPYAWGSTGIVYNTKHVDSPKKSWSLLQDPRLAGRVALAKDPNVVIGLTLKSLGYSLNSKDQDQLDQAVSVVRTQKPLLAGFLDPVTIREKLASEELWAAQLFSGDAAMLMSENENLTFFIPVEGSDYYVDSLAIPRDARNVEAAHLFINYILRPDVHADIANYTAYAIPNRAALQQGLVDEEFLASEASYPPRDLLEAWVPHDDEMNALWNKAWADIERDASAASTP